MVEARHTCPDCGWIDLTIVSRDLRDTQGNSLASASCQMCGWSGRLAETIGILTTEQVWDADKVGEVLLRVLAQYGAGPLVQALEFIGLLPKMRERPTLRMNMTAEEIAKYDRDMVEWRSPQTTEWNRLAQECRDVVMRRFMEASLVALFDEATTQNKIFAEATKTSAHPMLEEDVEVFGGDYGVVDIKQARKKKLRKPRRKIRS